MIGSDADDASRFEFLLDRYAGLLRNAIHRYCPRDLGISSADIEQEARVRLWRALERQKEFGDPASYIYRIAVSHHRCRSTSPRRGVRAIFYATL